MQLWAAHHDAPPPSLMDVGLDVPADVADVIARCLAKQPADRFALVARTPAMTECLAEVRDQCKTVRRLLR